MRENTGFHEAMGKTCHVKVAGFFMSVRPVAHISNRCKS